MKFEINLDFEKVDDETLKSKGKQNLAAMITDIAAECFYWLNKEIERRERAAKSIVHFCNTGRFPDQ